MLDVRQSSLFTLNMFIYPKDNKRKKNQKMTNTSINDRWMITWLIWSSTFWRRWSIAFIASTAAERRVSACTDPELAVVSASVWVCECVWVGFLRGFRGLEWSEGKRGAECSSLTQETDGNCEHTAHVGSAGSMTVSLITQSHRLNWMNMSL